MPNFTIPLIITAYKEIIVEAADIRKATDKAADLIYNHDLEVDHITPNDLYNEIDWGMIESCNPQLPRHGEI